MRPDANARALRVGEVTTAPGEVRWIRVSLPDRKDADAVPVWVAVGTRPGPKIAVVAGMGGYEAAATLAANRLVETIHPGSLRGSLVVVPVLRAGGRFAAALAAGRSGSAIWRFPGDATGERRAREAFVLFSNVCVGASVVVTIVGPPVDRTAILAGRGDLTDSRIRHLLMSSGAPAVIQRKPAPGSLSAAAADIGVPALELRTTSADADERTVAEVNAALRATLNAAGVLTDAHTRAPARRPKKFARLLVVRASAGGVLASRIEAGAIVNAGEAIAEVRSATGERTSTITAPRSALVVEATRRTAVRAGATVAILARLRGSAAAKASSKRKSARPATQRDTATSASRSLSASTSTSTSSSAASANNFGDTAPLRVGWVERVSLPVLGIERLRAKIDTGARTSALHVARMKTVGTTAGPHRRPILEVTVPAGTRRGARPIAVRVPVRDYLLVKDTSGRTERRPVIETTLRIGSLERRVRVTLTNRGDMLFPMLIGRTALGPGVVVDPTRRCLVGD